MIWSSQIRITGAAASAAALILAPSPTVAAEKTLAAATELAAAPEVSVISTDHGAYRVEGSFSVEAPSVVAWTVLADYDHLSSFISSMRSSASVRTESGRLLVIQEAVGHAGPFSRTLHVVLDVTEEPPRRIGFRDVCGKSFHSYVGAWSIEADGPAVQVRYRLDARPRSSPPFFARSILSSNARKLLEQVRLEMARRKHIAYLH